MGKIEEELKRRNLPEFPGNAAKEILQSCFYGYLPFGGCKVTYECAATEQDGFGGKAVIRTMIAAVNVYGKVVCFPFRVALPVKKEKVPLFLYLGFTPEIADGIGEWVLDKGYGIAHVYYQDMAADFPDHFQSGLARLGCRNPENSAGKLAVWAFGLSKVMDYLIECGEIDQNRITVLGHSRLGKTALLLGAFDERISLTAAIQSGAGGVALFRGKTGEGLKDLGRKFSREWLCSRAYTYEEDLDQLPFDQHFLVSLIAPRHLYIGSAQGDFWADPLSEYLSLVAGSCTYEEMGLKGMVRDKEAEERLLLTNGENPVRVEGTGILGQSLQGQIGWHLRAGTHYLSILDWEQVIRYREIHQI